MEEIFRLEWNSTLRILISAFIAYAAIIIYIRILGKRSTSEMNNFDWIVTVSLGSIMASSVVLKDVSVPEGMLSILTLLLLQYLVTKIMYYSDLFRETVKSTPRLLFFKGEFIEENMENERVLKPEVYAAIRKKGLKSVEQVYAVVLETNAKISVIPNENDDEVGFSLSGVQGLPEGLKKELKDRGAKEE